MYPNQVIMRSPPGVLLCMCLRAEQPAAASRDVPLVQRHSNPVQYLASGTVGARPAHQRARHISQHFRHATANYSSSTAIAGPKIGRRRRQHLSDVPAANQRPDHKNPQPLHSS